MVNRFSDKLTTEERKELPSSDFGLPETREFPMPDAAHVRAAESYFRYAPEDKKPLLAYRILQKRRSSVWMCRVRLYLNGLKNMRAKNNKTSGLPWGHPDVCLNRHNCCY